MVEMHLLAVNVDFQYSPFYGLGVVTSFNRFMQGYRPEPDKASIFNGLCQALETDAQRYLQDAERLEALAKQLSAKELIAWLGRSHTVEGFQDLQESLGAIAGNPKFKYSRLFAIGLFTLLETADADLVKEESQRVEALKQVAAALQLPEDKLQKDLELYRSNLEKMTQARIVIEDALKADRKKREDREKAKAAAANPSDTPEQKDEAPSES